MFSIIIVLVILIAVLSLTGFEINEKVEINAPVDAVWSTIVDLGSYSKWNSQLEYLGGRVEAGGNLHLKLSAAGAKPYEFRPTIRHWKEKETFGWLARTGLPRVLDGEHVFELEKVDENTTLVTNREQYRGVLSLVLKNAPMMKAAPEGFRKMNSELKRYVEKER
ncbi:MAG: SRPBCC domain-containing protein [Spirochaetes bacterium]|nr:SRPBCC domain-containing protein [Spirochaetota bacterium]